MERTLSLLIFLSFIVCLPLPSSLQSFIANDWNAEPLHRYRRQSTLAYNIDILAVTDYQLFKQWQNRTAPDKIASGMTEYFTLVIQGVNQRFQTMKNDGLNITVRLGAIHIATTATESAWTESAKLPLSQTVNATKSLANLQSWVNANYSFRDYDHVMLFTGYDIISTEGSNSASISGEAIFGQLCDKTGLSVSVVNDRGGFQSVVIAAHELGHSMNASHDGTVTGCSDSSQYIMASVLDSSNQSLNSWRFSSCSRNAISSFLQSRASNASFTSCLFNSVRPVLTSTNQPGQLYPPDQSCQQILGPASFYYRVTNSTSICTYLACVVPSNPSERRYQIYTAPDGTTCGSQKWCKLGECVMSSEAPEKDDACLFGDTPFIPNSSCSSQTDIAPQKCYDYRFFQECCQSCQERRTNNPACPFGDRTNGCSSLRSSGNLCYDTNVSFDCCGTCSSLGVSQTGSEHTNKVPDVAGNEAADLYITLHVQLNILLASVLSIIVTKTVMAN